MSPSWLWPSPADSIGDGANTNANNNIIDSSSLLTARFIGSPADVEKQQHSSAPHCWTCCLPRLRTRRGRVLLVGAWALFIGAAFVLYTDVIRISQRRGATSVPLDHHAALKDLEAFPEHALPPATPAVPPLGADHDVSVNALPAAAKVSAEHLPDDFVQAWGIQHPKPDHFIGGLIPWPDKPKKSKPKAQPLSELGLVADESYNEGYRTLDQYEEQLRDLVQWSFPTRLRQPLFDGLDRYLHGKTQPEAWDVVKEIWQTDKTGETRGTESVATWTDGAIAESEGWHHQLYDNAQANSSIEDMFGEAKGHGDNAIHYLWNNLPAGILRADLFRYLFLLLRGGIYTDTDTRMLQLPSVWGKRGLHLWKGGEGWLDDDKRARIVAGESIDAVLGKPSVVVGIEADVGQRDDWHQWWPRPLQFVQWTMASAPYHPIALSAVLRCLHGTARANEWAKVRWSWIKGMRTTGEWRKAEELLEHTVLDTVADGGPIGVMDWTGPGVWTDSVLSYLAIMYGVQWTDLRRIQHAMRIGDVVILPVTGFSPGVGQFGAGETSDDEAMVWHLFRGSWKDGGNAGQMAPLRS